MCLLRLLYSWFMGEFCSLEGFRIARNIVLCSKMEMFHVWNSQLLFCIGMDMVARQKNGIKNRVNCDAVRRSWCLPGIQLCELELRFLFMWWASVILTQSRVFLQMSNDLIARLVSKAYFVETMSIFWPDRSLSRCFLNIYRACSCFTCVRTKI